MNDELLTLYYYDDGLTLDERCEIDRAMKSDAELHERYDTLCRALDGLHKTDTVPAPTQLVAQWHDAIDRAAENEAAAASRPPRLFHLGSFFWGTAVAASLAVGVAIGVLMSGGQSEGPGPDDEYVSVTNGTGREEPAAFSRGLLVHFQQSRDQLIELSPDSNGERANLIMTIIQQNRLFERMAKQNDAQDLARVLRAFEPILLRLSSDDISAEDAAALQAQLAFELNIVLTKLARRVSNNTRSIDI
jgi:hypothetical protein